MEIGSHDHTQVGYGHGIIFSSPDEAGVNNNQVYYNIFTGNNYGFSLDIGDTDHLES